MGTAKALQVPAYTLSDRHCWEVAKVCYTTDDSTPAITSTLILTPIQVTSSKTVNAIAVASGYANSSAATAKPD